MGRTLLPVQPHPHSPTVLLPWAQRKYPCGLDDCTPRSQPPALWAACLIYFVCLPFLYFLTFHRAPVRRKGTGPHWYHRLRPPQPGQLPPFLGSLRNHQDSRSVAVAHTRGKRDSRNKGPAQARPPFLWKRGSGGGPVLSLEAWLSTCWAPQHETRVLFFELSPSLKWLTF